MQSNKFNKEEELKNRRKVQIYQQADIVVMQEAEQKMSENKNAEKEKKPKRAYCKFMKYRPTEEDIYINQFLSQETTDRSKTVTKYIQRYYDDLEIYTQGRIQRKVSILEALQNGVISKEEALNLTREMRTKETQYLRLKRTKLKIGDFKIVKLLGKGGYGEVFLGSKQDTGEVVSIKRILKSSFSDTNQSTSMSTMKQERDVMARPSEINTQWITELKYAFQDSKYFYLAMDYHCGGDFESILQNFGCLPLEMVRFYMSEMIAAVEELHKLSFIHRDIKPANFVIDQFGHLKLIDFGLTKEGSHTRNKTFRQTFIGMKDTLTRGASFNLESSKSRSHNKNVVAVGSPEYMAPEVLEGRDPSFAVDIWALGCIFLEMIIGFAPFGGDSIEEVFTNIYHFHTVINDPVLRDPENEISDIVWDLVDRILVEKQERISISSLKSHPFFDGVDWINLQSDQNEPPFCPQLEHEFDTLYFENAKSLDDDDIKMFFSESGTISHSERRKLAGFTFKPTPEFMKQKDLLLEKADIQAATTPSTDELFKELDKINITPPADQTKRYSYKFDEGEICVTDDISLEKSPTLESNSAFNLESPPKFELPPTRISQNTKGGSFIEQKVEKNENKQKKNKAPSITNFSDDLDTAMNSLEDIQEDLDTLNANLQTKIDNICPKCKKPVVGEHTFAMNTMWHVEHFSCNICETKLDGRFFEIDNQILCSRCHTNHFMCKKCGKVINSGKFYRSSQGMIHFECATRKSIL